VLLRFGEAEVSGVTNASRARGVPLTIIDDGTPEIARLYEQRLVLVRPDGHVAWRGDTIPDNALALIDRVRGAA
jgi:hypothetical protein